MASIQKQAANIPSRRPLIGLPNALIQGNNFCLPRKLNFTWDLRRLTSLVINGSGVSNISDGPSKLVNRYGRRATTDCEMPVAKLVS